jgi:hypothetical protein
MHFGQESNSTSEQSHLPGKSAMEGFIHVESTWEMVEDMWKYYPILFQEMIEH